MTPPAPSLHLALLAAFVYLSVPAIARADGAFPDSEAVLVPPDRPEVIVLVTNFGLMATEDGGGTWLWSCEQLSNQFGSFYQMGRPPRDRLHVVTVKQAAHSDDGACSWTPAGGAIVGHDVSDIWVDRTVADRLWATTATCCDADNKIVYQVFQSTDDGLTFDALKYTTVAGAAITGVESARSDPQTVYLTVSAPAAGGGLPSPTVIRSTDGGGTWTPLDLTAQIGSGVLRLMGVDVQRPQTLYLLLIANGQVSVVISSDGGTTASKAMNSDQPFKAFAQLDSGTAFVSVTDPASGISTLYRSRDHGASFQPTPNPPHVRGLASRAGLLYAATDNDKIVGDGFALSLSNDEGDTWTGIMSYDQVSAIISCVKTACQDSCGVEVAFNLWPDAVCTADPPPPGRDAGTTDAGAPADAGIADGHGGGDVPAGDAGSHPPAGGGCGCAVPPRERGRGDESASGREPGYGETMAAVCLAAAMTFGRRRSGRRRHRAGLLAASVLLAPLLGAGGDIGGRAAWACGVSTADGFSTCSFSEHEEEMRPRWHLGVASLYTSTAIRFSQSLRSDETRSAALASLDYQPTPRATWQLALGGTFGGHLGTPTGHFDFSPGRTAAVGYSYRILDRARPFVVLTSTLSFSAASTHPSGADAGPHETYAAFDARFGALAGTRLFGALRPYAPGPRVRRPGALALPGRARLGRRHAPLPARGRRQRGDRRAVQRVRGGRTPRRTLARGRPDAGLVTIAGRAGGTDRATPTGGSLTPA